MAAKRKMALRNGTMMGWLNSVVNGILVLQSEVTLLKISLSAEMSMLFVVVPSFSAFFWHIRFFHCDLSVVEGYGVDIVALGLLSSKPLLRSLVHR